MSVSFSPKDDTRVIIEPSSSSFDETEVDVAKFQEYSGARRTSRFFVRNSVADIPHGLDVLNQTSDIFLSIVPPELEDEVLESSHLYQLLNSNGQVMFSAVKTFHYENCDKLLEFDITILEPNGGGVLSIKGDSENISICTLTFNGTLKELVGHIYCPQNNCCCPKKERNNIFVIDSHNIVRFKLCPQVEKGKYQIISEREGKTTCGKIGKSEKTSGPASTFGLYGVAFDDVGTKIEPESKALLMAALLLVYFQSHDSNQELRKGGFKNFQAIFCMGFSIVMFIILSLLLISFITYEITK